jgi:hypothetical protein
MDGRRGRSMSCLVLVGHSGTAFSALLVVEREGRREVSICIDLRIQICDLLLRSADGISCGDEPARRGAGRADKR